nr:hypothetical protein [Mycoplasmopsis bovis]
MINVNTFKPGITFEDDGDIFVVLEAQHSKQGRGQANVKAKVKNLRTGSTVIKSYTGGVMVSRAHIDKRPMSLFIFWWRKHHLNGYRNLWTSWNSCFTCWMRT